MVGETGTKMIKTAEASQIDSMISAQEIVRMFHISYQTVNHYTDFGLLQIIARKRNIRFYDREVVAKRLKEIKELAAEGYSLRLIRKKLVGI